VSKRDEYLYDFGFTLTSTIIPRDNTSGIKNINDFLFSLLVIGRAPVSDERSAALAGNPTRHKAYTLRNRTGTTQTDSARARFGSDAHGTPGV
jgi:hypothetical protein